MLSHSCEVLIFHYKFSSVARFNEVTFNGFRDIPHWGEEGGGISGKNFEKGKGKEEYVK